MNTLKICGPPGTGKTTRALQIVEKHLAAGTAPQRIGYVSFTRPAVEVAIKRAMEAFNLKEHQLPYFKTLHSLCFRQLGLRQDRVMDWRSYKELGEILGMELRGTRSMMDDEHMYGMGAADRMVFMENLARVRQQPLRTAWDEANDPGVDWWDLERYARGLQKFKENRLLLDFTDMLQAFLSDARCAPKLDVLVVDEGQDLSNIQWDVLRILSADVQHLYICADDDQCIHTWCGASVERFLDHPGAVEVLAQSYRVPSAIHPLATRITQRIKHRQEKPWMPKPGDPGSVNYHAAPEDVDIGKGTWLLLARNGYNLAQLERMCEYEGFSFHSVGKSPLDAPSLKAILLWERLRKGHELSNEETKRVLRFTSRAKRGMSPDPEKRYKLADVWEGDAPIWHEALDKINEREREYFIAARKKGETLTKKPRIQISTIHSVKGGEADNVLLLTDVSAKTFETMQSHADDEFRVQYVGVTRAKQGLHIVQPQTQLYFRLD